MALPGLVTISNPQNRAKDSYASAPINLTVRANGEEKVMVMDAQGRWTIAGFNSPSVMASVTTSGIVGLFTVGKFWVYSYVYVAKRNYPLVENAQTGGGSSAPRSNPAPLSPADSVVNNHQKILSIPTTSRSDLSHIWIYRTLTDFTSAAEALTNGQAGVMFWIGEVENNPNIPNVPFTDTGADASGLEQIENDNFVAPLFDKVVYADPYFWGFGNSTWYNLVDVTSTGLVTVNNSLSFFFPQKWYDGRNGQTISLDGITTGGYDNHGSFFFKAIDNLTAQLYSDIALTNAVGVTNVGTTFALIRGASTTLYRSKPRNPFSWGFTDLIGDVQIPSVYQFAVGGSEGTAIAVISNQNLLKLDTEKPTCCYTLNLKNAGTPNFEASLRIISNLFSVSHHATQYTAVLDRGQTTLRSFDMKSYAIIDCDGVTQLSASNDVYRTLQQTDGNSDTQEPTKKSNLPSGIYAPKWGLNCFFLIIPGTAGTTRLIYQHATTGYWGTVDLFDVCCSAIVYDESISSNRIFVGTSKGLMGELFADEKWNHWFDDQADGQLLINHGQGTCTVNSQTSITIPGGSARFTSDVANIVPMTGLIGNWVTLVFNGGYYYGRIATIANSGLTLNFNNTLVPAEGGLTEFSGSLPAFPFAAQYYIGLIPMEVGRTFNGQIPFEYKKMEELHTAWRYRTISGKAQTEPPTIEFYGTFLPDWSSGSKQTAMIPSNNSAGQFPVDGNYAMLTRIPVDLAKTFGIIIRDRNMSETQLMSYEIRLSSPDGNNRSTNS